MSRRAKIIKDIVYPQAHLQIKEFHDNSVGQKNKFSEVEKGIFFNCECRCEVEIAEKFNLSLTSKFFTKMCAKGCVYQSSTIQNLRSCDSYAKIKNGKFVKIFFFVNDVSNKKNVCICNIIRTVPHPLSEYIHICIKNNYELISVDVKDIERQCVFMEVENLQFLSARPNMLHY